MLPDIKIKDFYLRYVHYAERDIEEYKIILENINKDIKDLYEYINSNYEFICNDIKLNLTNYSEWVNIEYDNKEQLKIDVNKILNKTNDSQIRLILIQIIKYCHKLKEKNTYKDLTIIAEKRNKLKLKDYKNIVNKYYTIVHKLLLLGYGYKFQEGIGTYIINYFKIDNPTKKKIDFQETNKRKKEIIEKGLKPYDDKEACWYKERNIPYNGIEYRVYLDKNFFYDIGFINSSIFKKRELDYQRTEYVHAKLRGLSYTEMADKYCQNIDDIVNLNVDIKYKLNIFLYKYPEKYLNFVRNADKSKYKY